MAALGNYIAPGLGDWLTPRRNTLAGLGAGLLNGQPGAGVQAGIQADDAYATQQKAEAERQANIAKQQELRAKYADTFAAQGAPSLLVDMVRSGDADPAQTFWDLQKASQPGAATDPTSTVGGRAQLAQTWGLAGDEAKQYVLTGKLPDAPKAPALPTSYQEYQLAQQDPNYAKTLNSTTSKPPTEGVIRNRQLLAVVEPEARTLLGDGATPGLFEKLADGGDQARDMGGDAARMLGLGPSAEYQTAKNALRTIIQNYLYSVSGATATPQEVENQANILTPRLGESEQSVNDKKRRIAQMAEAIKGAANPQTGAPDAGGYTVLSVE